MRRIILSILSLRNPFDFLSQRSSDKVMKAVVPLATDEEAQIIDFQNQNDIIKNNNNEEEENYPLTRRTQRISSSFNSDSRFQREQEYNGSSSDCTENHEQEQDHYHRGLERNDYHLRILDPRLPRLFDTLGLEKLHKYIDIETSLAIPLQKDLKLFQSLARSIDTGIHGPYPRLPFTVQTFMKYLLDEGRDLKLIRVMLKMLKRTPEILNNYVQEMDKLGKETDDFENNDKKRDWTEDCGIIHSPHNENVYDNVVQPFYPNSSSSRNSSKNSVNLNSSVHTSARNSRRHKRSYQSNNNIRIGTKERLLLPLLIRIYLSDSKAARYLLHFLGFRDMESLLSAYKQQPQKTVEMENFLKNLIDLYNVKNQNSLREDEYCSETSTIFSN